MDDEELRKLREQRMAELYKQQGQGQSPQEQAALAERQAQEQAQKEAILRSILSPDARERLSRVRIARPDQAEVLERQLIALSQSGRLTRPLEDEDVKAILARLFPPKREISIRRKGAIEE